MSTASPTPVAYRAIKAAAIVMALLLMVPGVEVLVGMAVHHHAIGDVNEEVGIRELVQLDDPYETLSRVEDMASKGEEAKPPEAFSREIGFLRSAKDIRFDESRMVVGYAVEGGAQEVLSDLTAHMESRGWTTVTLGGVDGATFVKPSGAYTWALATCTQIGESTSIVMRCMSS